MIAQELFDLLSQNDIDFFTGVPDSLLKDFCAYVTDHTDEKHHTITANEGNAISLAAGYYLAKGKPALVYMQNSGIGNCVNPLLSLTDSEVYGIPLLLLIGWRGEPGVKDEPQHIKQGKVTDSLLDAMGIKHEVLPKDFSEAKKVVFESIKYIKEERKSFAFIVRKGTFEEYTLKNKKDNGYTLIREEAIEAVIKHLSFCDIVVSTTGHVSREVYEIRERLSQTHKQDFLTVGSMGHASSIALGIALEKPERNVFCLDGDGSLLMHTGSLSVIASKKLKNFRHIVFNNEAHDSVGGQPTVASNAHLSGLAEKSGYTKSLTVSTKEELEKALDEIKDFLGTVFLEVKVKCGARSDLGRPKEKPSENKALFMMHLNQVDFLGRGAIENLHRIISLEGTKKALIFTGKKSFEHIRGKIEKEISGIEAHYYNDFSVNTKDEEVEDALGKIDKDFDIIIAVGGGSVIDFAKSYKYKTKSDKKLIAIPTTAGTGSEATQFAVLYVKGVKTSLDDPSILPEYAIIDPDLTKGSPRYLKGCASMDAYCHALESFWSVRSTPESRELAKEAIEICHKYLTSYVNTDDDVATDKMAKASNLAGKAINISRTTASHAVSYPLTSKYNIPHGHAVALTIGHLMAFNMKEGGVYADKRGEAFVKKRMRELKEMVSDKPIEYFDSLLESIGLENHHEKLGVKDMGEIVSHLNVDRLSNNPKKLTKEELEGLFE